MSGEQIGFIIWCIVGIFFISMGIQAIFSRKAKVMGFWANTKMFEITDLKKYNRAMAKLFCTFGIVFIFLGLPLLAGENSAWVLLSIMGAMAESIAAMVVYVVVIEKKYRRR
ncbi:MAG: hypothetical protein NC434_13635 [Ruminococcus sp.]|nr:hypothetical protein [Ruminococcus sp.]